jgi:uncharacterized membrane protein YphA (DoxX/SURF4 family)
MIATVASLAPTILVAVLTAVFLVTGTINLSGRGTVKADFARWGFPADFNLVCGGLELVGAALLVLPSTRLWGLVLLGAIMAGAIFSLLRNREPLLHLAPALAIAVLLALAAIVLSAGSFWPPYGSSQTTDRTVRDEQRGARHVPLTFAGHLACVGLWYGSRTRQVYCRAARGDDR